MSQRDQQEILAPNVTNAKSPFFEASELQPYATNNNSAQDEVAKNDLATDHTISEDESALRSSIDDGLQSQQADASLEVLSETDWMVFDKEAAGSDRDTIEKMSIGDFQRREETLEPVISLAQQDYEMQLRLLEAQNKRRLEMCRQEQAERNTQPSHIQTKMKGPPEPISMIMGSTKGNPTGGSGNKMATLPPGAPYSIPGPKQYPVNSMAISVHNMATLAVQSSGQYNIEAADKVNANTNGFLKTTIPMSPSPPDPTVLILQRQLKALQITNQVLRRQLKDAQGVNFAIFHCILGQEGAGTYLDKPYWVKSGENFQLKADSLVLFPDAYILYKPLAFVVYKYYSTNIPTETREALHQSGKMPDPEPNSEVIKLVSEAMIEATKAFAENDKDIQKKFPCLSVKNEMRAPYLWWYHCRDHRITVEGLPKPQAELIHLLTKWIDDNYSELYSRVDSQFKRGMVSAASMSFLIHPGDVLVRRDAEGVEACLAMSWLHKEKRNSEIQESLEDPDWTLLSVSWPKESEWKWEIDAWSYVYNGVFYRLGRRLVINLDSDTADTEIPIVDLDVFPLRFASQELQEMLKRRGKTFWGCRDGNYISYDNKTKNEDFAPEKRYMIDCRTYKNLHLESMRRQDKTPEEDVLIPEFKVEAVFIQQDQAPSEPNVYLFPRTMIGYDLQRKKWDHLNVDMIQEVSGNKNAFSHLIEDTEIKELVQALVTIKFSAERGTSMMQSKGNGLILLLHGGPGKGRAFTAESVAKLAKKPLLPVPCSRIGTKPKYLESMLHVAKTRGFVALLEDAEIFLEHRSVDDMAHNSLVSDFIREIECFDGILILTSKTVDNLNEAFKSRLQLSLHYESLTQPRRAQIWRDFLSHLSSLGEKNVDFDEIDTHISELSEREMNEHQICNAVTTARQLAQFRGDMMTVGHLRYAISITDRFVTSSKT